MHITAVGRKFQETKRFVVLGGKLSGDTNFIIQTMRRIGFVWAGFIRTSRSSTTGNRAYQPRSRSGYLRLIYWKCCCMVQQHVHVGKSTSSNCTPPVVAFYSRLIGYSKRRQMRIASSHIRRPSKNRAQGHRSYHKETEVHYVGFVDHVDGRCSPKMIFLGTG
ncbi:unnamed protein product [Discosporangium mesarthrocarpum]